jgi:hypothetical protein
MDDTPSNEPLLIDVTKIDDVFHDKVKRAFKKARIEIVKLASSGLIVNIPNDDSKLVELEELLKSKNYEIESLKCKEKYTLDMLNKMHEDVAEKKLQLRDKETQLEERERLFKSKEMELQSKYQQLDEFEIPLCFCNLPCILKTSKVDRKYFRCSQINRCEAFCFQEDFIAELEEKKKTQ